MTIAARTIGARTQPSPNNMVITQSDHLKAFKQRVDDILITYDAYSKMNVAEALSKIVNPKTVFKIIKCSLTPKPSVDDFVDAPDKPETRA